MNKEVRQEIRRFGYVDIESFMSGIDNYQIIRKTHKILEPGNFLDKLKTETDYSLVSSDYRRAIVYRKLFGGGLLSYAEPLMTIHTSKALESFPAEIDDSTLTEWYVMLTDSLRTVLASTEATKDTITAHLR
ncbi:hypothetical protein [Enterobacter cloacae complex sp. 418I7]|uniref:hypothetical protein n=1 Tax=Enterobacter cloacae complex sp. 418I7 TaxID=3395839 RepID=UPI003CEBA02C